MSIHFFACHDAPAEHPLCEDEALLLISCRDFPLAGRPEHDPVFAFCIMHLY